MSSVATLISFLLLVTSVTFGGLYLDTWQKNNRLSEQVNTLKQSQVLLSVPEEQASIIVNWMNTHPEYIEGMLKQAKSTAETSGVEVASQPFKGLISIDGTKKGPDTPIENIAATAEEETKGVVHSAKVKSAKVIEESAEGVKTIALPHGGIRITTR